MDPERRHYEAPAVFGELPEAREQRDQAAAARAEAFRASRRRFLGRGAVAVIGTGIIGLGVRAGQWVIGGDGVASDSTANDASDVPVADAVQTEVVNTLKPEYDGPYEAREVKQRYSIGELVEYAKDTEITTSAEDYYRMRTRAWTLDNASGRVEIETTTGSIFKNLIKKPIAFNTDPKTGEKLPDTREDMTTEDYAGSMQGMFNVLGVLPRSLVDFPTSYNHVYDFLVGEEDVKKVNGSVHSDGETGILSIDREQTTERRLWFHEYVHVAEAIDSELMLNGEYAALREYGRETFGTPVEMRVALTDIQSGGFVDESVIDAVGRLIGYEVATPVPEREDVAYTLGEVVDHGLLPETDIPLLMYFRDKQLQSIKDLSMVSGVDIGIVIAFMERFGNSHPELLAGLAQAGVLEAISDMDASGLGDVRNRPQNDRVGLRPGMHIVNIGDEQNPQYITMHPTGEFGEEDADDAQFVMQVAVPSNSTLPSLDIEDEEPETQETNATDVEEGASSVGPDDSAASEPFSSENEELTKLVNTIFRDDIRKGDIFIGNKVSRINEKDVEDLSPTMDYFKLVIDVKKAEEHIRGSKVVGMVNEKGEFVFFE